MLARVWWLFHTLNRSHHGAIALKHLCQSQTQQMQRRFCTTTGCWVDAAARHKVNTQDHKSAAGGPLCCFSVRWRQKWLRFKLKHSLAKHCSLNDPMVSTWSFSTHSSVFYIISDYISPECDTAAFALSWIFKINTWSDDSFLINWKSGCAARD